MSQDKYKISVGGRAKRLAKYLDVSLKKARKLLWKYRRSSVYWSNPPTPEEAEKQLFRMIESGERLEDS